MKVTGATICKMEQELNRGQMDRSTKVVTRKE